MKRFFLAGASVLFTTIFIVGQTQALEVMHPTGAYVQKPTGMAYPEAVGNFRRVSIIRYEADSSDESAGYSRYVPLKEIVATVYVFPSPALRSVGSPRAVIEDARNHLCTDQFGAVKKEVTGAHPDAVLLREGAADLVQGNVKHAGHFAAYKLTNRKFADRENVLVRSDVDVFCYAGGKWTVEYRIDYPFDYDASAEIAAFKQGLIWTIPPEPGN